VSAFSEMSILLSVPCLESAKSRPSRNYVGVTCIKQVCHSCTKTVHSVKILYWHVKHLCEICIQRTRWLAAKQRKLDTGSSDRMGRGMSDYLQRQTASVCIRSKLIFNPSPRGRHWMSGRTCQYLKAMAGASQMAFYNRF